MGTPSIRPIVVATDRKLAPTLSCILAMLSDEILQTKFRVRPVTTRTCRLSAGVISETILTLNPLVMDRNLFPLLNGKLGMTIFEMLSLPVPPKNPLQLHPNSIPKHATHIRGILALVESPVATLNIPLAAAFVPRVCKLVLRTMGFLVTGLEKGTLTLTKL